MKKDKTIKDYSKTAFLVLLSSIVLVMLSSFISRVFISPPVESVKDEVSKQLEPQQIQINILNANGVDGTAATVRKYLRQRGFDIVGVNNNLTIEDSTYIIDCSGDISSATKVAYAIGIDPRKIQSKKDPSLFVSCAIIIGKDFQLLKPWE
jgi:hypothetical protein